MNMDESFDAQFSQPEIIGTEKEGIQIIDLKPAHTSDQTPIFVAPGWAETPEVYRSFMRELFKYRRVLLTVGHPRKGDLPMNESEHKIEELRKATNILRVLEAKNIDQADFIAHSEGAVNSTIAATISPDRVQSMIFVNPAGMIGESGLLESLQRFTDYLSNEFLEARRDENIRELFRVRQIEALKYIVGNPFRALKETIALSQTEIHHLLAELHYSGIKIGILAADDDVLFPAAKIKQYVEQAHIDAYRVEKGGHNELLYHPEHYAGVIMSMLKEISK